MSHSLIASRLCDVTFVLLSKGGVSVEVRLASNRSTGRTKLDRMSAEMDFNAAASHESDRGKPIETAWERSDSAGNERARSVAVAWPASVLRRKLMTLCNEGISTLRCSHELVSIVTAESDFGECDFSPIEREFPLGKPCAWDTSLLGRSFRRVERL